jgi:hypothetical protein
MNKMLLTLGAVLAIAAVPAAVVGAQGFGFQYGDTTRDQTQTQVQDKTMDRVQDQTQTQTQLHLHDGTGDNHVNCDGTPGDMHRYGAGD